MTETHLYGVYGASGCGRSTMPIAEKMLSAERGEGNYELVFIDDSPPASVVNGRRVLTYTEFLEAAAEFRALCIGISNSRIRQAIADRCRRDHVEFLSVLASNIVIMDYVEIGEGAIISPFVTITSNVTIGRHFHANLYSYVEHDCVIGDFVTLAPGVQCNGNVVIEDHAYLGAGCTLRQGHPGKPLVVGCGATVGMGAVVTRDVPAGETIVGNPGRPLRKG